MSLGNIYKLDDESISMIKSWVNPKYLEPAKQKQLKRSFLASKPFRHLELRDFFIEKKAIQILKALGKEHFFPKESDLFQFNQTNNLAASERKSIQQLLELWSTDEFAEFMSNITGFNIKPLVIDSFASLYQKTDYLLCHDDEIEGRKIAWLLYLSALQKGDGGTLNLYTAKKNLPDKVVKKLVPQFNSFTFFEVSPVSFHAVEEMVKEKQRVAITGWFRD